MANTLKTKSFKKLKDFAQATNHGVVSMTPDEATVLTIVAPHSKLPKSVRVKMLQSHNLRGKAKDAAAVLARRDSMKIEKGDSVTVRGIMAWNDQFKHIKIDDNKLANYGGELVSIDFAPLDDFLSK